MNNSDYEPGHADQRSMGKWMIIGAWLGLLLVLTLLADTYLERVNNPNSDPATSTTGPMKEVVLQRNRAGHYVASGLINGKTVTFLLDTGATDVAVSDELATALGLRRGAYVTSQTANGVVTARQTMLAEVSIGDIRIQDVRATILSGMDDDEVLLGMSFLKQLELAQRGKQLLLRQYQ